MARGVATPSPAPRPDPAKAARRRQLALLEGAALGEASSVVSPVVRTAALTAPATSLVPDLMPEGPPPAQAPSDPGSFDVAPRLAEPIAPQTGLIADSRTTPAVPQAPGGDPDSLLPGDDETRSERAFAAPLPRGTRTVVTTFGLSENVLDLARQWQRRNLDAGEDLGLAPLFEAAFHDVPLDVQEAVDLVGGYPDEVFDGGRVQVSSRLTPDVIRVIKRLTFELRADRRSGLRSWFVLSAALMRQLEAEGVGF